MRPLELEFQAFGSYPGREVVDFRALAARGLFVVTGPTGSGKTTVFDAMVFALFGVLPGARGSGTNVGECRSDFAAADTETYVKLTFEVDGTVYVVHRSPAQERPKKVGSGTTGVGPAATVVRRTAEGEVPLATKANTAAQVCAELVGIDAAQFQRVVLLPQGKFTEFLLAGEKEREDLLRPLFGTHIYRRATESLNDLVKDLWGRLQKVAGAVSHHRTNAFTALTTVRDHWDVTGLDDMSPDSTDAELGSFVELLAPVRAARERERDAAQAEASAATVRRTTAAGEATRFDDAVRFAERLASLEEQRPQVDADATRARDSLRARPVEVAAASCDAARHRVDTAHGARASAERRVREGLEALGLAGVAFEAAAVATAVAEAATADEAQRQQLRAAAEADASATAAEARAAAQRVELERLEGELAASSARVDDLQIRISELEPSAALVPAATLAHTAAIERRDLHSRLVDEHEALSAAIAAHETARAAFDDCLQRFVATQAPLLAEQLVDGQPCAVCGSTEHPAPARHVDDAPVDHEQLAAAQELQTATSSAVSAVGARIENIRASLGAAADESADHFAAEVARTEGELCAVRTAADELVSARSSLTASSTVVDELRATAGSIRSEVDTLAGVAVQQRSEAARLADVTSGVDAGALDERSVVIDDLRRVGESLGSLFGECSAAEGALSGADAALAEAVAASGYPDVATALAAVLPIGEETAALAAHAAWSTSLTETTAALATVREQGVPAERPDVDALIATEHELSAAARATSASFTTASDALARARSELDLAAAVAADSAALHAEYDAARTVHRTCNGEGPFKVKLERWVLSSELGRVTDAANVHLRRMTNSRYTLRRDEAKGGLGLLVADSHSGKQRATASLSGGEQFQASLALALGLADVVSQGGTANGRTFEALFVDEGFGSLDPDALLQAIDALESLHAAGRMVGAITHVEGMKQSLHVGIEVSRLPGGGSTLTVKP